MILKAYLRLLKKRPLLTMSCTTGTLMALGDGISQTFVEKRHRTKSYDSIRTARYLTFGFLIGGPSMRKWYSLLDKWIVPAMKYSALRKMLLDQILFSPMFLISFWAVMAICRGESYQEIKESLAKNFIHVQLNGYKIWPAVQIINFYFVPFQHRVMVVSTIALGWNTYLAWKSENQKNTK